VLARWVVVPDAAGTVVEGYPTGGGSASRAGSSPADQRRSRDFRCRG
jgi:hypothetical protein